MTIGKPPCDDAVIASGSADAASDAAAAALTPAARRWVLVAAIGGSSMAFVDGTIVNVALPAIQRELGADAFQAQWVVESYALFLAALLLVGGALGDRLGRRKVFAYGVALFGLASLGCALAPTIGALITARAVQGIGAALLVPGSLALISASFPEQERGGAIGTWSGFSGITAAIGPVVGGWLVDHASWSWAFLINLPLAAAVLGVAIWRVPESRGVGAGALDVKGAVLATLTLGAAVYALIEAPVRSIGAPVVLITALVAAAAAAAFLRVESRIDRPMLPLDLFEKRNFAGANLLTLLLYAALGGGLYFLPLNLIQVQGASATLSGAALLPFILIMFLLSRWAGRLVDRYGAKRPLVVGPLIAAVGFALFAVPGTDASYWSGFFPAVVVLGFGMTVTVAPLTTTVMNSVPASLAGVASGVNNAVSRTAALLAIALLGMAMAAGFDRAFDARLASLALSSEAVAQVAVERSRLGAMTAPAHLPPVESARFDRAVDEAFVAGFRTVMLISAGLALAGAAVAWRLIGSDRRGSTSDR